MPAVAEGPPGADAAVRVTINLNEQLALLPLTSVAVQFTTLVPFVKVKPLGGVQLLLKLAAPQLSLIVGE
jgi:hypothetical protein